ncbi:hypothetical protein ASG87_07785 [Frateuria sp. Soil773]|uniref:DUF3301 domain-containing protein n=1 Tax=Frateuria sp. Soil773 TaxID=1736407 RepID=UPI0006F38F0F|nr:DUF3301 domain-containing protein [Frateuria sp. Soil773]KRE88490.1 hypothetical protein ASG87_07785 [Frateuria sp. Soil773]
MGKFGDLFLLLAFGALVGLWLKLIRAREHAVAEARRQCERHGLQLLDESVGLRGLRLRRRDGLKLERCYGFEVSVDGDDRQPGRIWMAGGAMSGLSLPTLESGPAEHPPIEHPSGLPSAAGAPDEPDSRPLPDNVISLRRFRDERKGQ